MKRRLFNLAAGISLFVLAILAWGVCSRFGVMVQNNAPTGVPPFYRETSFVLEEGRFRLWIETWNSPPQGTIPTGRTIGWVGSIFAFRQPRLVEAMGTFDAHFIRPPITKSSVVFILACPIWLLAALFCVVPSLWLWKWREQLRRQSEEIQGFPVC